MEGLAHRHAEPDSAQHRDLMALTASLERTAAIMKAVEDRLCRACGVQEVVELVGFGGEI